MRNNKTVKYNSFFKDENSENSNNNDFTDSIEFDATQNNRIPHDNVDDKISNSLNLFLYIRRIID